MIVARDFQDKDAEQASKVLVEAFKGFLGDKYTESTALHFTPDELIKEASTKNKFNVSRIFVVEDNGRVAGVVKITAGTNGLGVFDYVGVDPECHAQGIGAILMKKAEEFWEKHNQRKIDTCVAAHNKKAIMYYLKHDFIPEGYRKDHFIDGVDEIVLGRFLKKRG